MLHFRDDMQHKDTENGGISISNAIGSNGDFGKPLTIDLDEFEQDIDVAIINGEMKLDDLNDDEEDEQDIDLTAIEDGLDGSPYESSASVSASAATSTSAGANKTKGLGKHMRDKKRSTRNKHDEKRLQEIKETINGFTVDQRKCKYFETIKVICDLIGIFVGFVSTIGIGLKNDIIVQLASIIHEDTPYSILEKFWAFMSLYPRLAFVGQSSHSPVCAIRLIFCCEYPIRFDPFLDV